MKRIGDMVRMIFVVVVLVGLVGCGSSAGTSTTDGTSDSGETSAIMSSDQIFYDALLEVAPSISNATSASVSASLSASKGIETEWVAGNPLLEIFQLLRDFDPDIHQGVIDTSNIQKTMWEGKSMFSAVVGNCVTIDERIIDAEFDLGNDVTYNCVKDDEQEGEALEGYERSSAVAMLDAEENLIDINAEEEEEGEEDSEMDKGAVTEEVDPGHLEAVQKLGLFSFVWADAGDEEEERESHNEYGIIQGGYNDTTKMFDADIAVWVNYTGPEDYCYRTDISGNVETHLFSFKSVKGNDTGYSTEMSIVGAGISEGDGYFLLKVSTESITDRYYCIESEATEETLQGMDANGSAEVPAECEDHAERVAELAEDEFTTDDLLCSASDLGQEEVEGESLTMLLGLED